MDVEDIATGVKSDPWLEWLLSGRHGGDPAFEPIVRQAVAVYRDRVLDGLRLTPGMTLLDVGTGEGLIAFGALERVGELSVILTDVSPALLSHAEQIARERGFREFCSFVETSGETLTGIDDDSVDALTSRAVFAYFDSKPTAAESFNRVLKPGGRVSICEPLGQDSAVQLAALTNVLKSEPANVRTEYLGLLQRCRALQMPSTLDQIRKDPLTNFSERDLVLIFRAAGFRNIHMELHVDVKSGPAMPWHTFLSIAPRPGVPCLGTIFRDHLTTSEAALLERIMKSDVEKGNLTGQTATVYLTADKPS